jgi:hypothetical protein
VENYVYLVGIIQGMRIYIVWIVLELYRLKFMTVISTELQSYGLVVASYNIYVFVFSSSVK